MSQLSRAPWVVVFVVLCTVAQAAGTYTPGAPVLGDYKNFARGFLEAIALIATMKRLKRAISIL